MALSFESANRTRDVKPETFPIDGEDYTIYRPKQITIAKFAQATVDVNDPGNIPLLFQFLSAVFDHDSQRRLLRRMDDPHDGFDEKELAKLCNMLFEHFGMSDQAEPAKKTTTKKTTAKKTTKKA